MKILREPLFHFLLAGGVLFVLYSAVNRDQAGPTDAEILVSVGRINSMTQKFTKVWQRPPTEGELVGVIQAYIREEVLYRGAVAMKLDVDDEVVRRRMGQKLEFLSEDARVTLFPRRFYRLLNCPLQAFSYYRNRSNGTIHS